MAADTERGSTGNVTRRRLIAAGAAAPFGASLLSSCSGEAKGANTLGLAASGGMYNQVLRHIWTDDFSKQTGVKVNLSPAT